MDELRTQLDSYSIHQNTIFSIGMFDGIHLTDEGSVLVSEIIFDFITNKLKEEFMN